MLKSVPFANAVTVVAVGASLICWIIVSVAPDLAFNIANSWFHMINLDVVRSSKAIDAGGALVGAVSLGAATWVSAYAFAEIYKKFTQK